MCRAMSAQPCPESRMARLTPLLWNDREYIPYWGWVEKWDFKATQNGWVKYLMMLMVAPMFVGGIFELLGFGISFLFILLYMLLSFIVIYYIVGFGLHTVIGYWSDLFLDFSFFLCLKIYECTTNSFGFATGLVGNCMVYCCHVTFALLINSDLWWWSRADRLDQFLSLMVICSW